MFRTQTFLGNQKFFIEEDDFVKFFELVSHINEMNWRIGEATDVRWNVRRVGKRKFYDLVGYIKFEGETYRCEMTLGQYEEEGRPLPFFLRSNAKWKWYDFESETAYYFEGHDKGFVEAD